MAGFVGRWGLFCVGRLCADVLGLYEDVTERRHADDQLRLAASVFEYAREGICITDVRGDIIDVNRSFSQITGFGRDEVLGKNPRFLNSGHQDAAFYAAMFGDLQTKGHWAGEIWNRRKSGEIFVEMLTISAVKNARGVPSHYVAMFFDITDIKEHQRQLEHIAHFDALTHLPNRVLLADRFQQAMMQAQPPAVADGGAGNQRLAGPGSHGPGDPCLRRIGCEFCHGRFWYRLFIADVPEALAGPHHQDRPQLCP
jgi:PAS domain S-box-containing protein